MAKAPALVLSSGGLRSLICAAVAAREQRIVMLHLKDGRAPAAQAEAAFDRQVAHFKPFKSWVVDAGYLRQMNLPPETTGLVTSTSSDPNASMIPLRELQLLAVGAGFARQIKAGVVMWGAQYEPKAADAVSRNIELIQVFNQLLDLFSSETGGGGSVGGAGGGLEVRTPLMGLEDHKVIELGYQMGVPFGLSWTCQMSNLDQPCMSCPACARRTRAFRGAQVSDPLVVKKP